MREIDGDLDKMAHAVIGAAIDVHRALGPGFLEAMYEEALCIELESRGIPFARQVSVMATYRGRSIGNGKLDLLVGDRLVVELKAVDALAPVHVAQALAYLRMTNKRLALLINFNVRLLRDGIQRIAL
ncbi:MAG: GxxExxY protein [Thermomicrobiales bacterium]